MLERRLKQTTIMALFLMVLAGCSDHGSEGITETPGDDDPISLASDVQPILDSNCVFCHGAGGNAGLDLRSGASYANLLDVAAQNSSGDLVTAGDATASVLYQRMAAGANAMPPAGPLAVNVVSVVGQWIDEGALDN